MGLWGEFTSLSSQPIKKARYDDMHLTSSYAGSINRRTEVQAGLGMNMRCYLRNN
jgi:hypothetical protein